MSFCPRGSRLAHDDLPCTLAFMRMACVLLLAVSCAGEPQEAPGNHEAPWTSLFNGETLEGWTEVNFGAQGEIYIEDRRIILEMGEPLTGVTWTGEFPKLDYEVRLDAARLLGTDFFCGLTFPVGDGHCSLILGGWGGSLVGLSNVDRRDASENETRSYRGFATGQTYRIRLRVTTERIDAWVDGESIVSQLTAGHTFSIRPEVGLSRPFGIASFRTAAALSNLEMRRLDR